MVKDAYQELKLNWIKLLNSYQESGLTGSSRLAYGK